jgi:hypothetical protein
MEIPSFQLNEILTTEATIELQQLWSFATFLLLSCGWIWLRKSLPSMLLSRALPAVREPSLSAGPSRECEEAEGLQLLGDHRNGFGQQVRPVARRNRT